jgi:small subunit ribosomal protein S17
MESNNNTTKKPKVLQGTVVKDGNDKTVVVTVPRFVKHAKYQKFFKKDKRYQAHDENNEFKIGDKVEMVETRPISKTKYFKVTKKI